jgi:hypothetical protein
MRSIGNHIPPVTTQPIPNDNTSVYVRTQVRAFRQSGVLINPEIAREIAAWWQSPGPDGMPFAEFASTGTIGTDLFDCVEWQSQKASPEDAEPLAALRSYLLACTVTVYTVGRNTVGYLPESEPYFTLSVREARSEFERALKEDAPSIVARTDECQCGDDVVLGAESCELCGTEALARSVIQGGDAFNPDGTASWIFVPDGSVLNVAFWIHAEQMTLASYVASAEV